MDYDIGLQVNVALLRDDVSCGREIETALFNYTTMDWDYLNRRLKAVASVERKVGVAMVAVNRRVRARARRASLVAG
jgi:hypothetical protein